MANVTPEIATNEMNAWLDSKKIMTNTRESNEDSTQLLIDAMVEGIITIDEESKVISHNLMFPIGDGEEIKVLEYRQRLSDRLLEPYMKGVKPTDADGRLIAYICALTQNSRGIIKNMDSVDKKIALAIAVFFL
jgi:hypothetical protein